jgi:hypothetical protein
MEFCVGRLKRLGLLVYGHNLPLLNLLDYIFGHTGVWIAPDADARLQVGVEGSVLAYATLVKIFVTYLAREADLIGSSSLRKIADIAFFT